MWLILASYGEMDRKVSKSGAGWRYVSRDGSKNIFFKNHLAPHEAKWPKVAHIHENIIRHI